MSIKHHSKKISEAINGNLSNTIVYIVIAIVIFFLGYFVHSLQSKNLQAQITEEIFSGVMFGSSLSGKVVSVSPNSITIEVPGIMGVNLPKAYQTKTLTIDSSTKIISTKQKSSEEFNKELAEVKAKSQGDVMGFMPPAPFSQQDISISDLKPDTQISFSIDQSQDKGILDGEYKAVEIKVNQI